MVSFLAKSVNLFIHGSFYKKKLNWDSSTKLKMYVNFLDVF